MLRLVHTVQRAHQQSIFHGRRTITRRSLHSSPFDILFLGRDQFSCAVLNHLYRAKDVWSSISIATHPDQRIGRHRLEQSISPLKLLGHDLKLPVHSIPRIKTEFRVWKPPEPFYDPNATETQPLNHLLITASFGRILSSPLLNLFHSTRRLNVHPSLLPMYRGGAPLQHAILNGERETGVCIIQMLKRSEGLDSGAIWGSQRMPIPENATFSTLRDQASAVAGPLLVSVLRDMLAGNATGVPQTVVPDAPKAPLIFFEDSLLDFSTMTAETIFRRHRALGHQRPLTTYLHTGQSIQLHSPCLAEVYGSKLTLSPGAVRFYKPTESLVIRCADQSVLQVPSVRQEGRALIDARAWWAGVKGLGLLDNAGEIHFRNPS